MRERILVTGGAGYIGSHTTVQLLEAGYSVLIYDNFSNSHPLVVERMRQITQQKIDCVRGDIRDAQALRQALQTFPCKAAIHFAGLKAVGESEAEPLKYYDNNVAGSLILLEQMQQAGMEIMLFSSSATVYGDPGCVRYDESTQTNPINVYGRTKLMVEDMLRDVQKAHPNWRIALLRYFNPVGAHPSGLIGEHPNGTPNNLMPFIAQVATGQRPKVAVFGNDYPTPDGSGYRDYIHVQDLAAGHLAALRALEQGESSITLNLGTGRPYSVFEMLKAFERASGQSIPYEVVERRAGDLPQYYADPTLAQQVLGWQARYDIDQMCQDTWRWQKNNAKGYA